MQVSDKYQPSERATARLDEPPVVVELGDVTELTLGHQFNDTRDTRRTERW
jgi:hypothetical protein